MMIKLKNTIFFFCLIIHFSLFAQNIPLNSLVYDVIDRNINACESNFHTSVKPYRVSDVNKVINLDTIESELYKNFEPEFIKNFHIKKSERYIYANPLFLAENSYDFANNINSFQSGIGFGAGCIIKDKFSFSVNFASYNSGFVNYIDSVIIKTNVVPGQGYAYETKTGYCYKNYNFHLLYTPSQHFSFELGQGKHFFGDGYRSLLLSYNAFSYPYFKITTDVWKLKYVNLFACHKDIRNSGGDRDKFVNKFSSSHYLSWNVLKRLNISLFETIIWQSGDSTGRRGFDVNYLNPIIFYRPIEFSLGSPDNAIMGFNLKYKLTKKNVVYGQALLDDIIIGELRNDFKHILHPEDSTINYGYWTNKIGYQLGIKGYDIFKIENLSYLIEFNNVRPYTYSHRLAMQNYGHYNQPLAHSLGANFREIVTQLKYRYNNFFFEAKLIYSMIGLDSANSHFGQNIFQSTYDTYDAAINNIVVKQYGNVVGQGIKTDLLYCTLKASYLLNPENNLLIEAGLTVRNEKSCLSTKNTNFFFLGIRMDFLDYYNDY